MNDLIHGVCVPCEQGGDPMTPAQIQHYTPQIPNWEVIDPGTDAKLKREFTFKNFKQALAFTDAVGALAEEYGHHPRLITQWGKVTVLWWTHAVHGLHRNDFIMAAKTDGLI